MNIFTFKFLPNLLSIFFLSITLQLSAQDKIICGTETNSNSLEYINSIKSQITEYEEEFNLLKTNASTSKTVTYSFTNSIPLKIHILRNSDGSEGINVSDVKNVITNLNLVYVEAFIEFFICGDVDYIDDDELVSINKGHEIYLTETNNTTNAINIYFTNEILNDSDESICGYSNNTSRNDFIMIKNDCATNNSSLAHELGHFFSLLHTHGADDEKTTELVNGSNCDTDGDGICDTPADPTLSYDNVDNSCNYTGFKTDANGDRYNPDTNNIMSYARKECRNFFSQQQLARMYAFYHTSKNYLSCESFNADFTADISQTCEDILTVNFENNSENITQWEWDMNSDGITDYNTKNPTHTFETGVYDITLIASNKSQSIKKTYTNFIKVGTQVSLLNEDFEDLTMIGDHGWTAKDVSENGYNWLINKGETLSDGTGPGFSSNENISNTYLYAEASGAKYGDVAEFISPCITIEYDNSEIEFSYHMFGKHIGELHIDIKTKDGYINDIIEPLIGSQQTYQDDEFLIQDIDLSEFVNQTINIRFRAVRGSGWDGDIVIDNIGFKTIAEAITDVPVKVYPNPMKGDLLYVKTNNPDAVNMYYISNLEGQTIKSETLTNQPIYVGDLNPGMYLLTIVNKDTTTTKKIII